MQDSLGCLWALLLIPLGIAQIYAAYLGIDFHWGPIWAWIIMGASLLFRFPLPITVGAFFGALDVWGWEWYWAILFALPGLLLLIPGVIAAIVEEISFRFGK